jgi:hypothetical protein
LAQYMLNRQKVMQELQQVVPHLFSTSTEERQQAQQVWQWLLDHPTEADALKCCNSSWPLPLWQESLSTAQVIATEKLSYAVTAVDGSQIYPDRHQGIGCYLLNIGAVTLTYNDHSSRALCESSPSVFALQPEESWSDLSPEIINCQRGELELKSGLQASKMFKNNNSQEHLFLCDGSLIFWHLDSKEAETKERFLENSLALLEQFYKERLLIAGFISLPQSKELVNIIRTALERKIVPFETAVTFDYVVDADVLASFLPQHTRSALFAHCSGITARYPAYTRPYFMYLTTGEEIVRVEVPAWIAEDSKALTFTLQVILDQCIKGHGYPVALSEAHEQAVVKNTDREFFFHMLYKLSTEHKYPLRPSQKSLKKKFVSI